MDTLQDQCPCDPGTGEPQELLETLRQREEEALLAARLGNALLLENRRLREENSKVQHVYQQRLEELEQDRHQLARRLDGCRAQWESQVAELEGDTQHLKAQVERLNRALTEAQRATSRAREEHADERHLLKEQLSAAVEVERVLSCELETLKQEIQEKGHNRLGGEEELLGTMREQVARLSQKEQVLEHRLEAACQENADLRESLTSLHTRLALQDQKVQNQRQQLTEVRGDAEAAHSRGQQLQARVEELQEEMSLRREQWEGEGQQVAQEIISILRVLTPVVGQDSGLREEEEEEGDKTCQNGRLQPVLQQLKKVADVVAGRGGAEELNQAIVVKETDPCGNIDLLQELQDQISRLQEENAQLKAQVQNGKETILLQQAVRDRDEAISKKNAMEAELFRCKTDMMILNNQLLEAIQRKLELSQELEAWQDDIQVILNQQLRNQQQIEQAQRMSAPSRLPFLHRPTIASVRTRRPSTSPSFVSESQLHKPQAAWRSWLTLGKPG